MLYLILLSLHYKALGSPATYLSFSTQSNPSNASISLSVPTSLFFPSYQQLYSFEFWLRPQLPQASSEAFTVIKNPNDWNIQYTPKTSSLSILSSSGSPIYCELPLIPNNLWSHIAISYDYMSTLFSCYTNGVIFIVNPIAAIAKYPSKLIIGNNFQGNLLEMRVWVGSLRTSSEILQYFHSTFTAPYPSSLKRQWKLTLASQPNVLLDSIRSSSTSISSKFITPWVSYTENSLTLCNTGSYFDITLESCLPCASSCYFCTGPSSCVETKRKFVDFIRAGQSSDILMFSNIPSQSVATIEFWFKAGSWSSTEAELLLMNNFIKVAQRSSSNIVRLIDGSGTEVFDFAAQPGDWLHVAWALNGSFAEIYINAEHYTRTWANTSTSALFLGGSTPNTRFQGIIADLRMWRTVRNSTQILANLYTNFTQADSGMFRYFPMNDSGSIVQSTDKASTSFVGVVVSLWRSLNCTLEPCLIQCKTKQYADSYGECRDCHQSCQACVGPLDSDCSVCLPSDLKVVGAANCYKSCPGGYVKYGLMCITACPEGYFNESSACTACNSPCANCVNNSYCISCQQGYQLYSNKVVDRCVRICESGYFRNASNQCQQCENSCQECNGPTIFDCIQCASSKVMYNGTCLGSCPKSSYMTGRQCFDCDKSCLVCSGPGDLQCSSCAAGYDYKDVYGRCYKTCPRYRVQAAGMCVDQCASHYYATSDKNCLPCDASCQECNGPASTNCLKCAKVSYRSQCFSECPAGTFNSQNICIDCDVTCATCEISALNCTKCSTFYPYSKGNQCFSSCPKLLLPPYMCVDQCYIGFLSVNNTCTACNEPCKECQASLDTCISCSSDQLLFKSTCVDECPDGYISSGSNCINCNTACGTCKFTPGYCTSCSNSLLFIDQSTGICASACPPGKYVFNKSCVLSCGNGYFADSSSFCIACPPECAVCTDTSSCQSCSAGFYLQNGSCVKTCSLQYYAQISTQTCKACDPDCLDCTGPTLSACSQCLTKKFLYLNQTALTCVEMCPAGTYSNGTRCEVCEVGCRSCKSAADCISCDKGYFRRSGLGICVDRCASGDIGLNETCYPYSGFSPSGLVDLNSLSLANLSYPIPISLSAGTLSIYKSLNYQHILVSTQSIFNSSYISSTSLLTVLNTSAISYNSTYSISYSSNSLRSDSAPNFDIPAGLLSFSTKPYTLQPLIVIINNRTTAIDVDSSLVFVLDASESYDPSKDFCNCEYLGSWSCENYTEIYKGFRTGGMLEFVQEVSGLKRAEACAGLTMGLDTSGQVMEVKVFEGHVMKFIYVWTDGNREASAGIFLRGMPAGTFVVGVEGGLVRKVNVDKVLNLKAQNVLVDYPSRYVWAWGSGQGKVAIPPLVGGWEVSVAERSLAPGQEYLLTLKYFDMVSKTSAVVMLVSNDNPIGGLLIVSKTEGFALSDDIILSSIGWSDSDLPLSYYFTSRSLDSGLIQILSAPKSASMLSIALPGGNFTLSGLCQDALGASSESSQTVTIASFNNFDTISIKLASVPADLSLSNIFPCLNSISAILGELIHPYPSIQILSIKLPIISMLQTILSISNALLAESDNRIVYYYRAILFSLEAISSGSVSNEILEAVAAIMDNIKFSMFDARIKIYYQGESEDSSQAVISLRDLEDTAFTIMKITENFYKSTEIYSKIAFDFIECIQVFSGVDLAYFSGERVLESESFTLKTLKTVQSLIGSQKISFKRGQIEFPSLSTQNLTEFQVLSGYSSLKVIAKDQITLQNSMWLSLKPNMLDTVEISNTPDPFLLHFYLTSSDIQNLTKIFSTNRKFQPVCVFWDRSSAKWSSSGCSVSNLAEIFDYFDSQTFPETFNISCACHHLSHFSILFEPSDIFLPSSIIHSKVSTDFNINFWHHSIAIVLLVITMAFYLAFLGVSYYIDIKFRGKSEFIEVDASLQDFEGIKIEAVVLNLNQRFKRDASGKSGIAESMLKVLEKASEYKLDEVIERNPKRVAKDSKNSRKLQEKKFEIKGYLKVDSNKIRKESSRDASKNEGLQSVKNQLKEYENKGDSQVNEFLRRFDVNEKIKDTEKFKLKDRVLKSHHLHSADENINSFEGLEQLSNNYIVPVASFITGGDYSKVYLASKVIQQAKNFSEILYIPYWPLFWLILKKEHKFFSLFSYLHTEHSKSQLLTILYSVTILQLLFVHIAISLISLEFNRAYSNSNYCVWGCRYETELLKGLICAALPWPFAFALRYLFSKSLIIKNSNLNDKKQAYQNKICREYIGVILSIFIIISSATEICAISLWYPFSQEGSIKFGYCLLSCTVCSFVVLELISALFKAWLIWLACERFNPKRQPKVWTRISYNLLEVIPCLLPFDF